MTVTQLLQGRNTDAAGQRHSCCRAAPQLLQGRNTGAAGPQQRAPYCDREQHWATQAVRHGASLRARLT